MTTELTIPAAVWAHRVEGVPLVAAIVEGERCPGLTVQGGVSHKWCGEGLEPCNSGKRPPADLVALRDARCETCGGDGEITLDDDVTARVVDCPDCIDGRLLHDVRVECYCQPIRRAGRTWPYGDCLVPEPCTDGYSTVNGMVDVVRIDEVYAGFDPSQATALLSRDVDTCSVFAVLTPAHVEALGTIEPGMWAWLFTEVKR